MWDSFGQGGDGSGWKDGNFGDHQKYNTWNDYAIPEMNEIPTVEQWYTGKTGSNSDNNSSEPSKLYDCSCGSGTLKGSDNDSKSNSSSNSYWGDFTNKHNNNNNYWTDFPSSNNTFSWNNTSNSWFSDSTSSDKDLEKYTRKMSKILKQWGFKFKSYIKHDGNCQFTSVSDCLFGSPSHGVEIRSGAVKWLSKQKSKFSKFLNTDKYSTWEDYCGTMARDSVWGDHLSLVGICNAYHVNIHVISDVKENGFENLVKPLEKESKTHIWLCLFHDFHYRSIETEKGGGKSEKNEEKKTEHGGELEGGKKEGGDTDVFLDIMKSREYQS